MQFYVRFFFYLYLFTLKSNLTKTDAVVHRNRLCVFALDAAVFFFCMCRFCYIFLWHNRFGLQQVRFAKKKNMTMWTATDFLCSNFVAFLSVSFYLIFSLFVSHFICRLFVCFQKNLFSALCEMDALNNVHSTTYSTHSFYIYVHLFYVLNVVTWFNFITTILIHTHTHWIDLFKSNWINFLCAEKKKPHRKMNELIKWTFSGSFLFFRLALR